MQDIQPLEQKKSRKRKFHETIDGWKMKRKNYKELNVYIIKSDLKIGKTEFDVEKRKKSSMPFSFQKVIFSFLCDFNTGMGVFLILSIDFVVT